MSHSTDSQKTARVEYLKSSIIADMSKNQEIQIPAALIKAVWGEAGLRTFCKRHGWGCCKRAGKKIWTVYQPRGKKWNR